MAEPARLAARDVTELSGWPPEHVPFEVTSIDLSFMPGPHPLHVAHRDAIEANWEDEVAANPHLFNGPLVLQRHLSLEGGAIVGEAYEIPYSTMLWWRRQTNQAGAFHLFAFPVLVSSDGAIVAIRMSDHTANPGQVYCAAGSLDLLDIVDGKLDIDGNMRREVREETGLELGDAETDGRLFACWIGRRVVVFRIYRFDLTADDMIPIIEARMTADPEREIAGAVAIRSGDRAAHPYAPSMFPILDFFFGAEKR